MKDWIGHGISIVGLLISVFFGAMWLGSLETEVKNLKSSTVNAERIARLETRMESISDSNRDLRQSVERLLDELNERRPR